jgi:hypothetical protein
VVDGSGQGAVNGDGEAGDLAEGEMSEEFDIVVNYFVIGLRKE